MVWIIYLGDRLYDSFRTHTTEWMPPRHRFALRHRIVLWFLLAIAVALLVPFAALLRPREWILGSIVAMGVLLYFLGFRILSGQFKFLPQGFPAKEVTIAVGFTGGVVVASGSLGGISWFSDYGIEAAALLLLALANCLTIAEAEASFDAATDPASFYGGVSVPENRDSARPAGFDHGRFRYLPLPALSLGLLGLLSGSAPTRSIAVVASSILLGWLMLARVSPTWRQPLADATLLAPWVLILFA